MTIQLQAANYRVVELSPPGQSAQIFGARDGKAFGGVYTGFRGQAAEWDVDTGVFTSYHGPPWEDSYLYGGVGNLRVGYTVDRDGIFGRHAGAVWVNKVPQEFSPVPENNFAGIYGTDGSQHVGNATITGFNGQPIVWFNNNPQAWRDLTPLHFGFDSGVARAVHNGKQVGMAWGDADVHAILWRNTPGSAVDLHPAGNYHWSQANDTFNNEQVGFATSVVITFDDAHAYIWNNTAASARDVHPLGAIRSALNGTNGIFQVGYARPAGSTVDHAFIWAGTAESAFDLHSFLPLDLVSSVAVRIDERGYIYGNAKDTAGLNRAVVWIPIPEPAALAHITTAFLILFRRRWSAARIFVPTILLMTICARAPAANYRVIDLTPPGGDATILGARDGKAFGTVNTGLIGHAAEWDIDSGVFTSYHGPPYEESYLWGGAGNIRGGYTIDRNLPAGRTRATVWVNKVPVDHHPIPDLFLSSILDSDGTHHVGNASLDFGTNGQAMLYFEQPGVWRDLTPRHLHGFHSGIARAIDSGRQVGDAWNWDFGHAILWRDTPGSARDLHPSGTYTSSVANDIIGDEQVGYATVGFTPHAIIWHNTAASAVDVNPLGATRSALNGTNGIYQVGYARIGASTVDHAFIWSGTADSAFDLHSLLGPEFVSSVATEIDAKGYIYGNAKDAAGLDHAVVWIPIPEPAAAIFVILALSLFLARRRPLRPT